MLPTEGQETTGTGDSSLLAGFAAAAAEAENVAPPRKREKVKPEDRKKSGPPPFEPTEEQRSLVTRLKLGGATNELIARAIDIHPDTLAKHFNHELTDAVTALNGDVAATLYQKAIGGDTACLIFWAKTRMGWREVERKELTGADGRPLMLPCIGLEFVAAVDGKEAGKE